MFVTIILDTEYMGMGERHKWFFKNLSHAKANNWLVITHEYLARHYEEYVERCAERFYDEFEMRKLDEEEYRQISKGFVPDEIFMSKEKEMGSRTEFLAYLFQERYMELEQCLISIIDEELQKRAGEKVEGIFNCLDCFQSIQYLGEYYNCPVIPYVFSAIRKVHGYQQTLYMTSMDGNIASSGDGKRRYEKFKAEGGTAEVFSRRELLALLGKEHNIPLIKLLDCIPKYEMGVCGGAYNVNHTFWRFKYTDDDIYYECKQKYSMEEIKTRMHPMVYDSLGIGRESMKNDPVSFILSCKRVTSVQSQILLKAMLWNRAVYMKGDLLQFSFLCEKTPESTNKVDIAPLNYYIFGFLIPSEFMFDTEYWRWRIKENPSEHEIYDRHLGYILKCLGIDTNIIYGGEEKERFLHLLQKRNCAEDLINDLLEEEVPADIHFDVLSSKLEIGKDSAVLHSLNRLNRYADGKVYSRFVVNCENGADFLRFYPFADVGGSAKINYLQVDGSCIVREKGYIYYPKKNGYKACDHIDLTPGKHVVDVEWEYSF
ncbi:MAG: hypothetical protein HDQ99_21275 [Lachnospiraceae bacterium]|nr:hypothetical protein [Lachnospiraceae bacterium]